MPVMLGLRAGLEVGLQCCFFQVIIRFGTIYNFRVQTNKPPRKIVTNSNEIRLVEQPPNVKNVENCLPKMNMHLVNFMKDPHVYGSSEF